MKKKYKYDYKYVSVPLTKKEFEEFQEIIKEFNFNRSKLIRHLIQKFVNDYKSHKKFDKKNKNLTYSLNFL